MLWFASARRIRRLEEKMDTFERELRNAFLDWDNVYQKCRKLLGRIAKERATIEAHETEAEAVEPTLHSPGNNGPGSLLTPKQRVIQQQILRRRAGL